MAVRVAKIHAASAVPVVELTVVEAPRCAAIGELSLPNAAEDSIEFGIVDVEGVVVALELLVIVEEECKRVVDTYRREMIAFRICTEAKNARKKLRRCPLVAGRNDGVVQGDSHRKTLATTAAEYRHAISRSCRSWCEGASLHCRIPSRLTGHEWHRPTGRPKPSVGGWAGKCRVE